MGKKTAGKQRELARGINALGRSRTYRKQRLPVKSKPTNRPKAERKQAAPAKEPRWYSADDVARPVFSRKNRHKPTRLRSTITPGTVLIILAGRFRAKRVVFLKQLDSGLLLVTGPYKINGVPLRRVNQVYVIATSTQVDVSGVNVDSINDDFFARVEKKKAKGDEFFEEEDNKASIVTQERKDAQKKVDAGVLKAVAKVPHLNHYLNAKFSLKKGQYPHLMKF